MGVLVKRGHDAAGQAVALGVGALDRPMLARQADRSRRPHGAVTSDDHGVDETVGVAAVLHRPDVREGQPAEAASRSDPEAAVVVLVKGAHFVAQQAIAPGQVFDPIGMDTGGVALHAQQARAARADPQRSAAVDQHAAPGGRTSRRLRAGGAGAADHSEGFDRIADPDGAGPIFGDLAVAAGFDQGEGASVGSAPVKTCGGACP